MPKTHDFKNGQFFHTIKVKRGTPVVHTATTREVDEPFRISDSRVIRIWPTTTAIVIGKWEDSGLEEEEALFAAFAGHDDLDVTDDDGHLLPEFERA